MLIRFHGVASLKFLEDKISLNDFISTQLLPSLLICSYSVIHIVAVIIRLCAMLTIAIRVLYVMCPECIVLQ